ncbi:unique cartilage matrix-associated protein [Pseudophryne corroboree]|uniref:unique cartilage matrix-associated protein n=1 Tax=Pseudophryne corroboree TaxID=495146 RepID=UPI0030818FDB
MSWKRVVFLSLAAAVVLLAVFQVCESASVRKSDAGAAKNKESLKKIFMQESEASNFFKKRGKRSTKSQGEINGEGVLWKLVFFSVPVSLKFSGIHAVAARIYYWIAFSYKHGFIPIYDLLETLANNECFAKSFFNTCTHSLQEQEERTREQVEQWRQWHYDGLSPSYLYQRQNI